MYPGTMNKRTVVTILLATVSVYTGFGLLLKMPYSFIPRTIQLQQQQQ